MAKGPGVLVRGLSEKKIESLWALTMRPEGHWWQDLPRSWAPSGAPLEGHRQLGGAPTAATGGPRRIPQLLSLRTISRQSVPRQDGTAQAGGAPSTFSTTCPAKRT